MTNTASPSIQPMTIPQKQGVLAAILCTAFLALSWGLSAPLVAQHLERMTASGQTLGLLISLAAVATIVATPFVPKLLSRHSAKTIFIASTLIGSATLPLMKIFMFPSAWFALKFISSCAFTIVFVIAEIWINQLSPEHLRGRLFGIYGAALAGCMGIGSGLAVLTGIDGWMPFLICMSISLASIMPIVILDRAEPVTKASKEDARFAAIWAVIKAAPVIMMCAVVFGAIEQTIMYFLPVYDTRLGDTESMARKLLLIAACGNALFQIPMGILADKVNRDKLTAALMLVAFIGPLAMAYFSHNFAALAILSFFYVGLTTALYTVGLVQLGSRFKGHKLSAANAGFIMCYGIGSLIIPPIAGKMMDVYNPHGFLWTMAGLGLAGLLVVSVRRLRFNR